MKEKRNRVKNLITEDYCSPELSRKLKDKGFDAYCIMHYEPDGSQYMSDVPTNNSQLSSEGGGCVSCPTYQLVLKWFRVVHGIHIEVTVHTDNSGYRYYKYTVFTKDYIPERKGWCFTDHRYCTYEQATEKAIWCALEVFIQPASTDVTD